MGLNAYDVYQKIGNRQIVLSTAWIVEFVRPPQIQGIDKNLFSNVRLQTVSIGGEKDEDVGSVTTSTLPGGVIYSAGGNNTASGTFTIVFQEFSDMRFYRAFQLWLNACAVNSSTSTTKENYSSDIRITSGVQNPSNPSTIVPVSYRDCAGCWVNNIAYIKDKNNEPTNVGEMTVSFTYDADKVTIIGAQQSSGGPNGGGPSNNGSRNIFSSRA